MTDTTAPHQMPADRGPLSRRDVLIAGGSGVLGAVLAGAPAADAATARPQRRRWTGGGHGRRVLDVAATIEVLTTTVTTTALSKLSLPQAAIDTVGAASREELDHYDVITQYGGQAATHTVWIPDAIFASPTALFSALVVGEQICIDLYLVATTVAAAAGRADIARAAAELVGCEGVHRALARQALGLQPNDRAFMSYTQPDQADGPGHGMTGFDHAEGAIAAFEAAGFGFGAQGAAPGAFYDFDEVSQQTPNPPFVNTPTPQ